MDKTKINVSMTLDQFERLEIKKDKKDDFLESHKEHCHYIDHLVDDLESGAVKPSEARGFEFFKTRIGERILAHYEKHVGLK